MAQEVITKLIDDLDESEADQTVMFALDGQQYEIDLSAENAAKLREALAEYIAAGRRLGKQAPAKPHPVNASRGTSTATIDREQNRAMRRWYEASYRALGMPAPSGRGRIPQAVVDAYHAHGGKVPQLEPATVASGVRDRLDSAKAEAEAERKPPAPAKPEPARATETETEEKPEPPKTKPAKASKATKGETKPGKTEESKEAKKAVSATQGTPAQRRELTRAVRAFWRAHRGGVPATGTMPPEVWQAYEAQDATLLPPSRPTK